MVITELSAQKKKNRYNIFVDDVFYSGIGAEAIIKNGLKVGQEITKEQLEKVVNESEERSAFEKILAIISRQMQTRFEIRQKLLKYGYSEIVIANALKKAEDYGYVNDEVYAKMVVDAKKNKSKMEVKAFLFKKGISNNVINQETAIIDEEQERLNAISLAEKYMKNKEVNQKTLAGLYGFLSRKGFSSSSVSTALRKYKFDDFEE